MDNEHPKTVWQLTRGNRRVYFAAVLALLAATVLGYAPPLVVKFALDSVLGDEPLPEALQQLGQRFDGLGDVILSIWPYAVAIVVFTAVAGVFDFYKGRWAAIGTERVIRDLRKRVYDQLQRLPASYHDRADTGDLVQRCTSDVETIHQFLARQLIEVGRGVVLIGIGLPLMFALSVPMAIVSLCLIPLLVVYSIFFFIRIRHAFRTSDEAEGAMTARLQENLTNIRVVRAFARQDFERERFSEVNRTYRDLDWKLIRLLSWYWSVSDVICFAQRGMTLLIGAYWVMNGTLGPAFTLGSLLAFWMYVNRLLWPIRRMGRILTELSKASVSMSRLGDILQHPRENENLPVEQQPAPALTGRIDVQQLGFAHGSVDVLEEITFHVEPGETLAILGPSGSGKSTIINVLLRLYEYERGSVTLDGRELRELDRYTLRSQIGAVMQEPFLYSKSLRENILLSNPSAGEAQLLEAASDAQIHESVQRFDHGYDTLIGERGVTLSGGQRQRVALARALVADPAILILDDALSAVDTRTEQAIVHALQHRHGKRTTLVIAHRLSTLAHADRIIVLDAGRVIQSGTHEELLAQDGLYRRLWKIQSDIEADLDAELTSTAAGRGERS